MDMTALLERELQGSVDFFLHYSNLDPSSQGYGLTVDSTKDLHMASIAATGFALSGWVIAAERSFLPRARALEITRGTLRTLLNKIPHHRGFFTHFVQMRTGARWGKSEYSTIDTALCLNGVITAAAYFRDDEVQALADALLRRVDWHFIVFEDAGITLFRMAYNPDHDGDYVEDEPGFISRWDMAAEQKMMYLQAVGQIAPELARRLYAGFRRDKGIFDGREIIVNPGGTLFCYQFSEAWLDTAKYLDPDGIDWFANARLASLAHRQFAIDNAVRFKTFHARSWGCSAGDGPRGYEVSGAPPLLRQIPPRGTVSIYGALSSLPFVPDHVLEMMTYLYEQHPQTWGKYGFYDSYNLDADPPWYSRDLYGIDKGCSMLMVENYLTRLIWETYTQSAYIQKALSVLGFRKRE